MNNPRAQAEVIYQADEIARLQRMVADRDAMIAGLRDQLAEAHREIAAANHRAALPPR